MVSMTTTQPEPEASPGAATALPGAAPTPTSARERTAASSLLDDQSKEVLEMPDLLVLTPAPSPTAVEHPGATSSSKATADKDAKAKDEVARDHISDYVQDEVDDWDDEEGSIHYFDDDKGTGSSRKVLAQRGVNSETATPGAFAAGEGSRGALLHPAPSRSSLRSSLGGSTSFGLALVSLKEGLDKTERNGDVEKGVPVAEAIDAPGHSEYSAARRQVAMPATDAETLAKRHQQERRGWTAFMVTIMGLCIVFVFVLVLFSNILQKRSSAL